MDGRNGKKKKKLYKMHSISIRVHLWLLSAAIVSRARSHSLAAGDTDIQMPEIRMNEYIFFNLWALKANAIKHSRRKAIVLSQTVCTVELHKVA